MNPRQLTLCAVTFVLSLTASASAQSPAPATKSDPGAGNSVQCWDMRAAVVRDKDQGPPRNDTSAVAGSSPTRTAPSTSTPARTATPEERANAKRPPGMVDC